MKFRHKDGGVAEVFTKSAIEKLKKSKDYTPIVGKKQTKVETPTENKEVEEKPLQ